MAGTDDHRTRWTDVVWRPADGLQARLHLLADPATGAASSGGLVVDVHGGAWASRDRTLGQAYHLALAAAGLTVVAVDFRDGRQARHPAAVDDIAEAVIWARESAGLDHDGRLALTGSSSGGHLALLTALTRLAELEIGLVAALWPPVDPLGRYHYARSMVGRPVPDGNRLAAEALVASTEAYFGDEDTMGRASIARLVRTGGARRLPPLWLVEAGRDLNVPAWMLDDLVEAYREGGGAVDRTVYPDEIHGFGHGESAGAARFRTDLVTRLRAVVGPM